MMARIVFACGSFPSRTAPAASTPRRETGATVRTVAETADGVPPGGVETTGLTASRIVDIGKPGRRKDGSRGSRPRAQNGDTAPEQSSREGVERRGLQVEALSSSFARPRQRDDVDLQVLVNPSRTSAGEPPTTATAARREDRSIPATYPCGQPRLIDNRLFRTLLPRFQGM